LSSLVRSDKFSAFGSPAAAPLGQGGRMQTREAVTTASVLARGTVPQVRAVVVRLGRKAWVAPAGPGWVLVLPERPQAADPLDPFDLLGLGRGLTDQGIRTALLLSVRRGLGVAQLLVPRQESSFVGWRGEESGHPAASRAEPGAVGFCRQIGVPERAELLELLLEDVSGSPEERLGDLCRALGLTTAGLGATADDLADERVHLPGVERLHRHGWLRRRAGTLRLRRRTAQ
jgi:hypothetical protein